MLKMGNSNTMQMQLQFIHLIVFSHGLFVSLGILLFMCINSFPKLLLPASVKTKE